MTKKTKLWADCSKEEHKAIRDWNKERKLNNENFKSGLITQRQYKIRNTKLLNKLNDIEKQYR